MSNIVSVDDIIIGAGMGGLTVGALLAHSGRRVLLLEAHDTPGGYAHTFSVRNYRFCAQVHYVFGCGEGESIHSLLDKLGLAEQVPFVRLDVEGFDHVVVGGDRFRIPSGLAKLRDRLIRRFPEATTAIRDYIRLVSVVGEELDELGDLPERLSPSVLVRGAVRFRHLIRHLRSTLQDVFDRLKMPPRVRAVLAGQCGDYLLPPRDVSFLLHVALVYNYDRGAYYPLKHYYHFVDALAASIKGHEGSSILLEHEVLAIETSGSRVVAVTTKDGRRFEAQRFISNVDPRRTISLIRGDDVRFDPHDTSRVRYRYSCGTFTLYLAVRGLDLRDHGFGSFNVWHYPDEDINRIYDDQLVRHDLSRPWLFMSTPTLHSDAPGLCPPGEQILEVATACDHTYFARLRRDDRRRYNAEKKRIRETMLGVIEQHYVPDLRRHLSIRMAGTPATNERFCWAPAGNSYGAELTPANVGLTRKPWRSRSFDNLWLVNATAGFPSVAGTVSAGIKLYQELSGDRV